MKNIIFGITLAALCCCASGSFAAEEAPPAQAEPMTRQRAHLLIERLADDDIEKAMAAADELAAAARLAEPKPENAEQPEEEEIDPAAQAGEEVLAVLVKAATLRNDTVRRRVAGILGRVRHPVALHALRRMFEDDSDAVVREAVVAIGNHGRAESIGELKAFLLNKDPLLRLAAVTAVGRIGGEGSLPWLKRSCMDDDARVRKAAVVALGLLEDRSAVPILITRLDDDSTMVRRLAHIVLRKWSDTDFNYDPAAEKDERRESMKLWKTWWETNKNKDGDTAGRTTGNENNPTER